jgi:hypothetical protein
MAKKISRRKAFKLLEDLGDHALGKKKMTDKQVDKAIKQVDRVIPDVEPDVWIKVTRS